MDNIVKRRRGGNPLGKPDNLKRYGKEIPPLTHEEAVKYGSMGGKISGLNRRQAAKMDAAFYTAMLQEAKGPLKETLIKAGYKGDELNNAHAVFSTVVAMAIRGDLNAAKLLLDYQQALTEEIRKTEESIARIEAMKANAGEDMSVSSADEDGGVVIYLPKIEEDEGKNDAEKGTVE